MQKLEELYSGKAKSIFKTDDADLFVMEFRDDTSAFDGVKKAKLSRKGEVNNKFNAFIMSKLAEAGVPVHFVRLLSERESLVKRLQMIPVECVVRNVAAGSLCRRLGVREGMVLTPPTYELFLKNDELHDPMINEHHARAFGWATDAQLEEMKALTFKVNDILKALFDAAGMTLVDYKLEFGLIDGKVTLGDEFSPDGCRIWDKATGEKMDKDRFRQDLGDVIEYYEEVGRRLGVQF
ncbi:phosphoribosylaminoimidazole-succinocarboxamide synthase [Hahella chejuensis KCTC 2396]|uniref:Phosphoribosylaminoimidazole-succinocarboxamide synthase n=1 Tax=Hahella chejuensis (strain KCTC 2396) TaxID=349521 RepID=PUR7_HAHCH|nr:phosphoribosylaminoimidazolesuccinocarboxamide synthase [Hahella chejuensis]Q2SCM9.1 RecName: Full=Phosphoribosylaminoimidazole-succinocarboxamide synthase; AltName: Full=SAICAR synthetase [Hahella chejuensis KCTC 2396]ABC31595.1 phosphoribosylaminoimidazole-succinocarboxamide synthase [Hahella chejuensis KCTC 2396]